MWRSDAAASTTELQAALCTVVTAAPQLFPCDHHFVSFRENLPVRASASAVMKGVDAYDFLIVFRREKKENPMNKKGEF